MNLWIALVTLVGGLLPDRFGAKDGYSLGMRCNLCGEYAGRTYDVPVRFEVCGGIWTMNLCLKCGRKLAPSGRWEGSFAVTVFAFDEAKHYHLSDDTTVYWSDHDPYRVIANRAAAKSSLYYSTLLKQLPVGESVEAVVPKQEVTVTACDAKARRKE